MTRETSKQEIVGWRIWTVSEDSLVSPVFSYVQWPHHEPLVACCEAVDAHQPPVSNCQCGIYAARYMPPIFFPSMHRLVLGLVRLWGQVSVHGQEGWRAQFARPIAITNRLVDGNGTALEHGPELNKVAEAYGIPCIDLGSRLWKAAVKELGAPSTKWFGPPLHNYVILEGLRDNGPVHIVRCTCGFTRTYPRSTEHLWVLDWVQHWAELESR